MLSKVMKQAILSPLIAISVVLLLSLNASAQGENGIVEPADGSVVGGYVTVRGIANHSEFKKFQLDLLLFGVEEDATFIHRASGRKVRVSNLTAFDSSKYPDGEHRLRLRVVRDGMNYDEYFTTLVIDNSNNVDSGSGSGITRPQDGSTVGRLVNVLGIARDRNFRKWQLELLPFGDANSPILFRGIDENEVRVAVWQNSTQLYFLMERTRCAYVLFAKITPMKISSQH